MSERERTDETIREALAEVHRETAARTPPFRRLWGRAAAMAEQRRGRRDPSRRWATAAAAAALLVAVGGALIGVGRLRLAEPDPMAAAETAAATLGAWQAPLDFLLETPGRGWLESTPNWTLESVETGWSGSTEPSKEVVR